MTAVKNDEIDLVDLWLVLLKGKRFILYTLGAFLLLAALYVYMAPEKHKYQMSVEIGSRVEADGGAKLLESYDSVQAKLNDSYIPLAVRAFIDSQNPDNRGFPDIEIFSSRNGGILTYGGVATREYADAYPDVLDSIAQKLVADHQRMLSTSKKELELSRQKVANQIEALADEESLFRGQLKRTEEKARLIEKRIDSLKRLIASSQKNRREAVRGSGDASKALVLMMMDNEIRAARGELAELEERLTIDIVNERDLLNNKIHENRRLQIEKKNEMLKYDIQLANLLETRPLGDVVKSVKPVGPSKKLVLVLAVFAGLFVGIFVVFFREFMQHVQQRKQDADSEQDSG